jgi:predicted DNA-binding protein
MSALIIRMPQEKRERLQQVAKERNLSVNKLIEEMATVAIAEHDAEVRFHVRAARGQGKAARGLELLRKAAGRRSRRPG